MRAHWATPVYLDGFLFGCSGRNEPDADLRVVRWKDGEVQWVHRNRDRTTSLAVDGHLIVLGEQGLLQLIRGTSSRFRTRDRVGSRLDFRPRWFALASASHLGSPSFSPMASFIFVEHIALFCLRG